MASNTNFNRRLRIGSVENESKENFHVKRKRILSDVDLQCYKKTCNEQNSLANNQLGNACTELLELKHRRACRPALSELKNFDFQKTKEKFDSCDDQQLSIIITPKKPKKKTLIKKIEQESALNLASSDNAIKTISSVKRFVTLRHEYNQINDQTLEEKIDLNASWLDFAKIASPHVSQKIPTMVQRIVPNNKRVDSSEVNPFPKSMEKFIETYEVPTNLKNTQTLRANKTSMCLTNDEELLENIQENLIASQNISTTLNLAYLVDFTLENMYNERAALLTDRSIVANRRIAINWFITVHDEVGSSPEVLYGTVNLVDQILNNFKIEWNCLQLVVLASFRIIHKFKDASIIKSEKLIGYCDGSFTIRDLNRAEKQIFSKVGYNAFVREPMSFVFFYAHYMKQNFDVVINTANYLLDCILFDDEYYLNTPSHLAAAAVYTAIKLVGNKEPRDLLCPVASYRISELNDLSNSLLTAVQKSLDPEYPHRAPFYKFNSKKYNFLTMYISKRLSL